MTSSDITMIIHAGLGNQLFMIFTGLSKAFDENKGFSVYPIYDNGIRHYYFTNIFKKLLFKVEDKIENIQQRNGFEERSFNYNPIPKEAVVLKGYFQSPKYFDHNKNKIIKYLELDKFQERYKFNFKSVVIHLRFEDFCFNQSNHHLLRPSYYINALCYLFDMIPNATDEYKFVVFAQKDDDDIVNDYIEIITREVFNKTGKIINLIKVYDINPPDTKDYQEMMYMSNCNHFITANSSFSWFAAYLSPHSNKLIFYPDEWFGPRLKNEKNTKDLFPDTWIKIKAS